MAARKLMEEHEDTNLFADVVEKTKYKKYFENVYFIINNIKHI